MDKEIIKRSGLRQTYQPEKIAAALRKVFAQTEHPFDDVLLNRLIEKVESALQTHDVWSVELIQDLVERALMESGCYDEAKSYILYRQKRTELRRARHALTEAVQCPALEEVLVKIQRDFDPEIYSVVILHGKFQSFYKQDMTREEALSALVKAAVELTTQEAPRWEMIAARLLNFRFHLGLSAQMEKRGITDLYSKLRYLTDEGLYG